MTKTATKKIILDVYNALGEKISQRELSPAIFGMEIKEELLHFAVVVQSANERGVYANTLTRGEVRGGGKKPWKQKGTGRARHGSIRSPIWRGGGVVFGPRANRNFSMKINKKVKQKAICMALAQKAQAGKLVLVDSYTTEKPKTKDALAFLKKLPLMITAKKSERVAFLSPKSDLATKRSFKNLPFLTLLPIENLNVIDVMKCGSLVAPLASIDAIEKRYGKELAETKE